MRLTGVLGGAILLATFVSDGGGQSLTITANPGKTPGIELEAYSPQRNEGVAVSEVRVGSNGQWQGSVTFQATCCLDVIRGRQVNLNHIVSPQTRTVSVLRTGESFFPLTINARGTGGRPAMLYGKYLVQISVKSPDGTQAASSEIGLTVFPDEKLFNRSCHTRRNKSGHKPSWFARESTKILLQGRIMSTENPTPGRKPDQPEFLAPIRIRPDLPHVVRLEFRDLELPEYEARLIVADPFQKRMGGVAIGCIPANRSPTAPVELLVSDTMKITKGFDPTIVLRMKECRRGFLGICWGKDDWIDTVIFADEGFWDVVGGKEIKLVWVQ